MSGYSGAIPSTGSTEATPSTSSTRYGGRSLSIVNDTFGCTEMWRTLPARGPVTHTNSPSV